MIIVSCEKEKYALNLNPYQIFVFVNEKTKPYLEQFQALQKQSGKFKIVLIDFDAKVEAQNDLGDDIDPQLYNVIVHSDVVARVMPKVPGDYRYATESFWKGKNYDFDYMSYKIEELKRALHEERNKSYVNTLRRYFQYGNDDFSDFVMDVFDGDLSRLVEMSQRYTNLVSSKMQSAAESFTEAFLMRLQPERREELVLLIKDTLGYCGEKESEMILNKFVHYKPSPERQIATSLLYRKARSFVSKPNFKIVVSRQEQKGYTDKDGDVTITIVKDDGSQMELSLGHRGEKMIYLLTVLCQKYCGGFPNRFFKYAPAKTLIAKLYDRVYRSGGGEWVEKMYAHQNYSSMYRTHAKESIEKDERLDADTVYWLDFENQTLKVGRRNEKLEIRKIRLPIDNIVIDDDIFQDEENSLEAIVKRFPAFDELFGYKNPAAEKLREIHQNLLSSRNQREDTGWIDKHLIE